MSTFFGDIDTSNDSFDYSINPVSGIPTFGLYDSHSHTLPAQLIDTHDLAQMVKEPTTIGRGGTFKAIAQHDGNGKTLAIAESASFAFSAQDHDNDNKTREEIKQLYSNELAVNYLAFTSSSHQQTKCKNGKDIAPVNKWKVIIPFSRALTADEHNRITKGITHFIGTGDDAQARITQIAYVPNKLATDAPYEYIDALGDEWDWVDPDDTSSPFMVKALAGWQALQDMEAEKETKATVKTKPAPANNADAGIIEKIADYYSSDMAAVLTSRGYKRKRGGYLAPNSSSGVAGGRILERDGKEVYYSHHSAASDPLSADANGGHALDIPDVICILEFDGDQAKMIDRYAPLVDPEGNKQRQIDYAIEKARQEAVAAFTGESDVKASDDAQRISKAFLDRVREVLELKQPDEELAELLVLNPLIVDRIISQTVRQSNSRGVYHVLTKSGRMNNHTERDCWSHIIKVHGSPYCTKSLNLMIDEYIESFATEEENKDGVVTRKELAKTAQKEIRKALANPMRAPVLWHIEHHNQVQVQTFAVDRFIDDALVNITEFTADYTLPHVEFAPSKLHTVIADYRQDVIAEYKGYFPEFDEVVGLVVDCLFSPDRKQAYLWLQAQSDWGKGVLQAAFEALGTVTEISVKEVEACMEGQPVGKQPTSFIRSCILWVNEFKTIKSEIKQLESKLSLTPKFQGTSIVEVYAKFFTSAEDVPSLINGFGAEEQLMNRFSKIEGKGKVEHLPTFIEMGGTEFIKHLAGYIMERMNTEVKRYQAMGRSKSERESGLAIKAFHQKHGLRNHGKNLNDSLNEIADDFLAYLYDQTESSPTYGASNAFYHMDRLVDIQSGGLGLRSPKKVLNEWLAAEYDKSELGQVSWKKDEILRLISHDGKGQTVKLPTGGRQTVIVLKPRP